ncbi:metallopeptidase family protein [Candidatus Microgenomates bacterium]|nr:MAG: metallopeptidase family protein [Candidatus Microgenomates bacterium]
MLLVNRDAFEQLVTQALNDLPHEFARKMTNVDIVVEGWPTQDQVRLAGLQPGMTLFGLYQGIPQTKRLNYSMALPDKITIFSGPIIFFSQSNPEQIKAKVRETVLHEIGHHFGMSDAEIYKAQKDK